MARATEEKRKEDMRETERMSESVREEQINLGEASK